VSELETAEHRQGFASMDEIERAVLEASGTISFFAKSPTPDVARHAEILARIDRLSNEVAEWRQAAGRGSSSMKSS
jgi:uncharacterized membrane protein YcaP (DUF421 family)